MGQFLVLLAVLITCVTLDLMGYPSTALFIAMVAFTAAMGMLAPKAK